MGRRLLLVTLLLLTTFGAWADEAAANREAVEAGVHGKFPNCKLGTVHTKGLWAIALTRDANDQRQHLLHSFENRWEVVVSAPAIAPATLSLYGVPPKAWESLLGRPLTAAELAEAKRCANSRIWSWTSEREVTDEDCAGRSVWELLLMRNEILASHGRSFVDPELDSYFRSRGWYTPKADYDAATLNQIESDNAEYILYYLLSQRHF